MGLFDGDSFDTSYAFNIGSDGRHMFDGYSFDGVVDDFLAFNDVLTTEEINTLAKYYGFIIEDEEPETILDNVNEEKLVAVLTFDENIDNVDGNLVPSYSDSNLVDGKDGLGFATSFNTIISYQDLKFGTDFDIKNVK